MLGGEKLRRVSFSGPTISVFCRIELFPPFILFNYTWFQLRDRNPSKGLFFLHRRLSSSVSYIRSGSLFSFEFLASMWGIFLLREGYALVLVLYIRSLSLKDYWHCVCWYGTTSALCTKTHSRTGENNFFSSGSNLLPNDKAYKNCKRKYISMKFCKMKMTFCAFYVLNIRIQNHHS